MNDLLKIIRKTSNISPESFVQICEITKVKEYKAKQDLYHFDEIPKKIFFLNSGHTKSYSVLKNGEEYIRRFHTEGEFMGGFQGLVKNIKPTFTTTTITNCTIIECNYKEFISLTEKNIEINILYRKYLELIYMSYSKQISEYLSLNARERYLKLILRIPEINKFARQKHIAAHLGITPTQLNRVKKQILLKQLKN